MEQSFSKQKPSRYSGYKTKRMSKSYTDISSQISGDSVPRFKDSNIQHRSTRPNLPTKKIDYDFLRNLLGVGSKMGERKRTIGERFLNDELKEAVLKLRKEVMNLKLEIKDKNWLKTLDDLGDIKDMNLDLLEALYMLRNAYKKGIFSSTQCVKDFELDADNGLPSPSKDQQMNQIFLASPEFGMNTFSHHNRSSSPMSTASHVSSDWSSDLESTSSSIIVKRRPAKPRIHLSSASLTELMNRDEEILILQANKTGLRSEDNPVSPNDLHVGDNNDISARPGSADSSTSYLNLGDDFNSKPSNEDENINSARKPSYPNTSPTEPSPDTRLYEEFRSDSPTSCLLRPLFQHSMSSGLYEAISNIRSELSPKLNKLGNLENDMKLFPILQVKLAVLQEEKRQLMNIIKQKRGIKQSVSSYQSSNSSSPINSRGASPTSFTLEADEAILIRPSPRRAMVPKETQTEHSEPLFQWQMCPYCLNKVANNTEVLKAENNQGVANIDKVVCKEKIEVPENQIMTEAIPTGEFMTEQRELIETGVQSNVDKTDAWTTTMRTEFQDASIGDNCISPVFQNAFTETAMKQYSDKSTSLSPPEKSIAHASIQHNVGVADNSSQVDKCVYVDKTTMFGCAMQDFKTTSLQVSPTTKDASFGDDIAVRMHRDNETQHAVQVVDREAQCVSIAKTDEGVMCGCGLSGLKTVGCETFVPCEDFQCGDGQAEVATNNSAAQCSVETRDICTSPIAWQRRNFSASCNFDKKESVTAGFGEDSVNDLLCDACANRLVVSSGVGSYNIDDTVISDENSPFVDYFCRIDDKLCECEKPQTFEIAVGDENIDKVVCDICENKTSETIGCGDDRTDMLPCDKCYNISTTTTGYGDNDVTQLLCQQCVYRGGMVDKEIGNADVFIDPCEKCQLSTQTRSDTHNNSDKATSESHFHASDKTEDFCETRPLDNGGEELEFCTEVYEIMKGSNADSDAKHHPVICNYCGNKVDINDPSMDDELAKMRENFSAYKTERLAITKGIENLADFDKNEEDIDGGNELEEYGSEEDDDDDDVYEESTRNDIVESCKMLQNHFSGEKPLKQQLMLKYLANIESLWFQTVKKKRANAAVVKSYIDLFQSRIPELVDTIINLMDDDGNTALHFALTYKSTGVVSILLDSNVCQIDLVNKAGYSPVMLAALAGFDNKTDKYVMQRLLRSGDVNCKNKESGQTPLMLSVNRNNVGMVDLLLDAGADVNETDNDGSTALMCACENGSMAIVKALLSNPDCDSTMEDHEGSTALTIAMDSKRRDLALLIYGSLNFDVRGRIKLTPSKQSLLGLGTRRSPSPVIGKT